MKNLRYIWIIYFLGFNSCNDLDLLPIDRVTTATFYKTASDFDGAMFASYSSIQDFWGSSSETLSERGEYWKLSLVTTDDVVADKQTATGGNAGISLDLDNLFFRASDVPFAALYTQIYEGIFRANTVLDNLDEENELSTEEKARFEGEAKFLRAWFHFQALKMFGTPPLAMEIIPGLDDQALPNATRDALFTAILDDLNTAAANLPDQWGSNNTGRVTSWTAKSYIGKVNVWKEDWQAAITAFEDVISNGPYILLPNYEEVFAFDRENNLESIFEIQFGGPFSDDNLWVFDDTHTENFKATQGIGRTWYWDAASGRGAPGGKNGYWEPSQDLVDQFEAGDERLEVSIYKDGDMYYTWSGGAIEQPYDPSWSETGFNIKKYRGPMNNISSNYASNSQADFNNERWYRFGELKLLYAEALLMVGRDGDATVQINDIRSRAGIGPLAGTATMDDLMKEKRVELAFEPHRWFDIVRWDIGASVFGSAWDPKYIVFPFPQSEIDRSGGLLIQNNGY